MGDFALIANVDCPNRRTLSIGIAYHLDLQIEYGNGPEQELIYYRDLPIPLCRPLQPSCFAGKFEVMSSWNQTTGAAYRALVIVALASTSAIFGQEPAKPAAAAGQHAHPVRLGVHTPGVSRPMSSLEKEAVFALGGSPDWSVVTKDAVFVTSGRTNHVVQLLPATNKVGLTINVQGPCSGLADGFGSIWAPSCGAHSILRIDPVTGSVTTEIKVHPANSEGGITVGAGSVWMVVTPSTLARINPQTNTVVARIELPSGSENPLFSDGFIWVSSFEHDQLLKVDPASGSIVSSIAVGPKPRFLTAGAGSIWTLNQGDGTISRVDAKTGKLLATISCGIAGGGGEITFGAGSIWATMFDFPVTQVDPATNTVVKQWAGAGGDGLRFGFDSLWLSNGRAGNVWRLSPHQP